MLFCPPPFMKAGPKIEQQIPGGTGTPIGSMTGGGGLAASFNGAFSENTSTCSRENSSGTTHWIGKTFSTPKILSRIIASGVSGNGFSAGTANPNFTLTVRGKNGAAPSSATDGSGLGSSSFTDTNTALVIEIPSTDTVAAWDHIILQVTRNSSGGVSVAELELYELA